MYTTLYIYKLTGSRRKLAATMKNASMEKQNPTFDRSYIHLTLTAYNKYGNVFWAFSDGDYDKDRYSLTNARYVFVMNKKDCALYITSPEDVATFASSGVFLGQEFQQIHDLSKLNVLYSDIDTLKEQSFIQNVK